ncbi:MULTISPECIES: nucleotidyltransferase substrate binding protein [Thermus]|uniref:nucleotidyltransferase substrate binding protein n=1 Tax=Thermus TaxID=270 RepID=UPI001FAA347F|nr:nucleotidyltransferase substrate binding protein [Thermus neutrinimicus]
MGKERLRERLHLFRRAVDGLASVLAQPKNEFLRDSAIQRFEFTFELAWKVLKEYLEYQGIEARSPRAAIRSAFQVGLLPEDPGWLEMLELRNLTSHTYDEALAEKVYGELPNTLERFRHLLQRLEEVEGKGT